MSQSGLTKTPQKTTSESVTSAAVDTKRLHKFGTAATRSKFRSSKVNQKSKLILRFHHHQLYLFQVVSSLQKLFKSLLKTNLQWKLQLLLKLNKQVFQDV